MPRYFFHTADGRRERDTEGTELPDHNTARRKAVKFAGTVLSQQPEILWDGHDFRIEVTDHNGLMLFTIIMLAVNAPASGQT
jgi:hypothetical protein